MPRCSLRNLTALGGLAALLLSAPVALSPWLARTHWVGDLLANLVAQALCGLLLALLLLAAVRRLRAAALAAAFAAVAASHVLPTWWCATPAATTSPPALRLLTLNLLRENDDYAAALAAIHDAAPDVIFCSEVTPAWLTQLEAALAGGYPHRVHRADPGWFGVALYSRLPLEAATVLPLAFEWAPAIRATVRAPGGPVGVLGVHTPRPGNARRNHERDLALAAIPAALSPLPRHHVVLGDFNASPWTPAMVDLLAATGLRRISASPLGTTWPAKLPAPLRIAIDHVLASANLFATTITIGQGFGSDHLPLAAHVGIGPGS
ncbi:MAG: endonuclease/exonuclease/phosphatase family protein [Planctomycetes bacterium]|nr:endonuclease/exonuclease/phosphatase family protein [Planctomycetota bacterium]